MGVLFRTGAVQASFRARSPHARLRRKELRRSITTRQSRAASTSAPPAPIPFPGLRWAPPAVFFARPVAFLPAGGRALGARAPVRGAFTLAPSRSSAPPGASPGRAPPLHLGSLAHGGGVGASTGPASPNLPHESVHLFSKGAAVLDQPRRFFREAGAAVRAGASARPRQCITSKCRACLCAVHTCIHDI